MANDPCRDVGGDAILRITDDDDDDDDARSSGDAMPLPLPLPLPLRGRGSQTLISTKSPGRNRGAAVASAVVCCDGRRGACCVRSSDDPLGLMGKIRGCDPGRFAAADAFVVPATTVEDENDEVPTKGATTFPPPGPRLLLPPPVPVPLPAGAPPPPPPCPSGAKRSGWRTISASNVSASCTLRDTRPVVVNSRMGQPLQRQQQHKEQEQTIDDCEGLIVFHQRVVLTIEIIVIVPPN